MTARGETAADASRTRPTRWNLKERTRPGRVLSHPLLYWIPLPMAWRGPRMTCGRRGLRAQSSTGRAARAEKGCRWQSNIQHGPASCAGPLTDTEQRILYVGHDIWGETARDASGTRQGRVRFFKFHRVGRVRDASAAVLPQVCTTTRPASAAMCHPRERLKPSSSFRRRPSTNKNLRRRGSSGTHQPAVTFPPGFWHHSVPDCSKYSGRRLAARQLVVAIGTHQHLGATGTIGIQDCQIAPRGGSNFGLRGRPAVSGGVHWDYHFLTAGKGVSTRPATFLGFGADTAGLGPGTVYTGFTRRDIENTSKGNCPPSGGAANKQLVLLAAHGAELIDALFCL
eukprot:gene12808-biopygen4971